jgi:GTPase-associated protein 1, N-terminal domain type 1
MAERDAFMVDQCLFGYADGHRLLESSTRVPAEIASDLTALSDVAPGARFAGSNGYWTGFPVPRLARYGLMYTWPAPEMPRPGCVWTHLLLLDPTVFEVVEDLSCFEALMRRPEAPDDFVGYTRPIAARSLEELSLGTLQSSAALRQLDRSRAITILEVLYGDLEGPVEVKRPGEIDDLVLAVWSQQWPRLRRNFRFQTAASTGTEGTNKRFDLQLRLAGAALPPSLNTPDHKDLEWREVAVDDIENSSDRRLRTFLWRYGQDVKRQRGSFRPLAQLFGFMESAFGDSSREIPPFVARYFPDIDDASTLKRDLMDGIIFGDAQVDSILFLCEVDKGRSLPMPSKEGLRGFANNWPTRSIDMMRLAEWAATEQGELAEALLSAVAKVIPSADFWKVTEAYPEMRRRMVANQPDLLDAEPVASLAPMALATLLDTIPADHEVGAALVRRLPAPVDHRVVQKVFERLPSATLLQVIDTANRFGVEAAGTWLHAVGDIPSRVLDPAVMARICKTSVLLAIAEALDWLSEEVLKHGLEPWAIGLRNAKNDLTLLDRDRLEAFLFALALVVGGRQVEEMFERSFGYLHDRITHSYLSWPAQKLLQPKLPNTGYFRDWDDGLKLRLSVTQAYVRFNLDPASFGRLVEDKYDRKMLRRAAEEVYGGQRFADVLLG